MSPLAIRTEKLNKTFRVGFGLRRVKVIDNLNLEVREGEILGYLGPNGAGKTTTFKLLLDLIRPDNGSIFFWGKKAGGPNTRKEVGFLPENPYFYSYLTATESLDFHGRLYGIPREIRRTRIVKLLAQVGLDYARNRQLRKFSRGMLQRIGIAQALMNDPKLLILDEPMSGLDPMGRKEMRDIILSCRDKGKTVIFSSHILSDVEMICDRAAILLNGRLQDVVSVTEMLNREVKYWEITCTGLAPETLSAFAYRVFASAGTGDQLLLKISDEAQAVQLFKDIEQAGARLVSFGPHRESLEDVFVQKATERLD